MITRIALVGCLLAGGCSLSGSGTGHELDGVCRFGSVALATGLDARMMAGQLQAAVPKHYPLKPRNIQIARAALTLMLAADSAAPTPAEDQDPNDPAFASVLKAQAGLRSACA